MLDLPNLLTLTRIVAVPPLIALLWWPGWTPGWALGFALYCLLGLTDFLDGYVARARHAVSRLGTFLDPIADKILVASVLVLLVASGRIAGAAVVAAIVILVRELIVSGLREFLGPLGVALPVSRLAKWKTSTQFIALGALILAGALPAAGWIALAGTLALWAAALLSLITGHAYLRTGLRYMD